MFRVIRTVQIMTTRLVYNRFVELYEELCEMQSGRFMAPLRGT